MKEIGSEFYNIIQNSELLNNFKNNDNTLYTISGRTAINFILKNINISEGIVYMPSYCCESMIIPFLENKYKILFYNIFIQNGKLKYNIDTNIKCDVFFAMSYFGFTSTNMDIYIKEFNNKNIIVIEDITHRLLCDNSYCKYSDYIVASIRKWIPIYTGGVEISLNNKFLLNKENYQTNSKLVLLRKKAMNLKRNYIIEKIECKKKYLYLFDVTNNMFKDCSIKLMDNESLNILNKTNIEQIKKIRKNNAKIIIDKIKENPNVELLCEYEKSDCPLFVPVILKNVNINKLKEKLIDNSIYLPTHWPKSKYITTNISDIIYYSELSLVCDQRYNKEEIINYIDTFLKIVSRCKYE